MTREQKKKARKMVPVRDGNYTTDHSTAGKGVSEKYWWMTPNQRRRAIAREGKPQ